MKLIFGSIFGIVGIIFVFLAFIFLAIAGGAYYFIGVNTQNWVLVKGTVTAMSERESQDSDGNNSTSYCPTVKYTTQAGEPIENDLNECSTPPAYNVGDSVEVYYNPQNPNEAILKGGVLSSIGTIFTVVFGILGALFCIGGVGALVGVVITTVWRTKA